MALRAASDAERVLPLFEKEYPKDKRPRKAIEAIRAWAQGELELGMAKVRKLSLDSHAAARGAKDDAARFAARAAGQAVATWHAPNHALAVPYYARKSVHAYKTMPKTRSLTVNGTVKRYPGPGAWHFIALPKNVSKRIAKGKTLHKDGWGYVYVDAKVGKTSWRTSLWPKPDEGVYLLLVKATVRKKEGIMEGSTIRVTITLG